MSNERHNSEFTQAVKGTAPDHCAVEDEIDLQEVVARGDGLPRALQFLWLQAVGVGRAALRADRTDRGLLADLGPRLYMLGGVA